jgi:hypothetical protein
VEIVIAGANSSNSVCRSLLYTDEEKKTFRDFLSISVTMEGLQRQREKLFELSF